MSLPTRREAASGAAREAAPGAAIAPLDTRLGYLIKRAEHDLITVKERLLRREELSVTQYSALLVLAQTPGITGAQLARQCLVTPQSMVPVLASLEDRGFIERQPSTAHAKVYEITLTAQGTDKLESADRLAGGLEHRLAAAFTETEHRQLRDLLERAIQVLASDTADVTAPFAAGAGR